MTIGMARSQGPAQTDTTDRSTSEAWPLTEAQAALWYAQRLDRHNPIFNTAQYTTLRGELNRDAFTQAVHRTMQESLGLALRAFDIDGVPHGRIDRDALPQLQWVDCQSATDAIAMAMTHMRADMQRPLDLEHDALAAQIMFQIGPDHHLWYERVHHLATDGYGMALIDGRVVQWYGALTQGRDAGKTLGEFAAVLGEAQAYLESEKRVGDSAFWSGLFANAEPVVGMAEGVPLSAHHFFQAECRLSDAFSAQLRALDQSSGVSWPDILLALSAAYTARMTGRSDCVVGAPFMGRLGSASARVPAMVMNVLAIPISIDESQPLADFLLDTARLLRRARRHGRYRSEQLRRDLGRLGGQRRMYGPLINVLPFDPTQAWADLTARVQVMCAGPVDDFTITFRADPLANQVGLAIDANPALYSQDDVDAHLLRLQDFLQHAVHAYALASVPTLRSEEYALWCTHAYGPVHPVPRTTLAALIEQTMRVTPDAVAVVDVATPSSAAGALAAGVAATAGAGGIAAGFRDSLTYAELDKRTAQVAAMLTEQGVGAGDIVAVGIPRSLELVIALVGILRAGAAYLPLDLAHPRERLAAILSSATPKAVLVVQASHAMFADDAAICIDALDGAPTRASLTGYASSPAHVFASSAVDADDPAYVIYTSGSTGAPKGVVVNHDAIVNRLLWMADHYDIDASDRILQKTPATFDVSVWEFFLPLITGGVLVVAPPEAHKDPLWLLDIIREQAITTMHFVPSMLSAFLVESSVSDVRALARGSKWMLKRVFCSGEALPASTRDRFHQVLSAELHNLYGPTEAAVDVSYWPASATDRTVPVPIGFPVWNTALYVLDDRLRPAPIGVAGHLYLAGRQLAQGYLGRDDLTAERFVANPFGEPGTRMYATGDLARRRGDGSLVFLGRSDHQIKIRGLRIELEEIEAVLAHAPGVAQVAVLARVDQPGQDRIVAYVVAHEHASVTHDNLRAHAAQRLPDYMVPLAFVVMPDFPVTANGKLNRRALPVPPSSLGRGRALSSTTEHAIAELFASILQTNASTAIGADDDFFALGGHSLLAAKLASDVRQRWGGTFSLGAVFEHPTVSRLAQHLDALTTLPDASARHARDAGGFGPVLTLRQSANNLPALFCLHPAGGLSWCYGALARTLPERTVYGVQARALHPNCIDTPDSMDRVAQEYVDAILKLQPQGPFHLAGWSVGGIIAHAIAEILNRHGHVVGGLIMLDAYPSDSWRDQPEPPPDAIYKALLHIAGYDPAGLIDLTMTRDGVVDFLRRSGHPLGELPEDMIDGVFRVVAQNNTMVRLHHHRPYPGHLMHFRAAQDHEGENLFPRQWAPYVASMDIHDVQTVHAHMVGAEATAVIAPVVGDYLSQRDEVVRTVPPARTHSSDLL